MDITSIDPQAALYVCRASYRPTSAYDQLARYMPTNARRALDVGCGTGTLAFRLAQDARFVVGLDISPTMIALARQKETPSDAMHVAWVIANGDALPFSTQTFDFITSMQALRFTHPDTSLPDLRRVVQLGGKIAIHDLVMEPRMGFWLSHLFATFRLVPRLLNLYGWRGMFRLVRYSFSSTGICHARQSRSMNAAAFMDVYQRHFPETNQRIKLVPGILVWENKWVIDE